MNAKKKKWWHASKLAKFRLFDYIHSNSHQEIAEILAKIASTRALFFL